MSHQAQQLPLEIELEPKHAGGRIVLRFRYERLDEQALGAIDGRNVQAFADLLATIGEALKQGHTAKDIQTTIEAAKASFDRIKERQREETPTHG